MDNEDLILVGFGKHDLKNIITWIDDPVKSEDLLKAPIKWPPRYRASSKCSDKELEACKIYIEFLTKLVVEYEDKYGEAIIANEPLAYVEMEVK